MTETNDKRPDATKGSDATKGPKERDWNAVVATVEGAAITEAEVETLLRRMGDQAARFQSEDQRNQLKDELVNQELLYLDAAKKGLDQDEEFQTQLALAKKQMLQQYALHKLLSQVNVTEEDVKEYYDAHQDRLHAINEYHASHILVDTEEKAKEMEEKLKAGSAFEDLAKENSSCPSSQQGGDLGTFHTGDMVPEFDIALQSMEPGDVSSPVKTQFGYHIIKLHDKKQVQGTSLEENKAQLQRELTLLKQQEVYVNQLAALTKEYDVVKFY